MKVDFNKFKIPLHSTTVLIVTIGLLTLLTGFALFEYHRSRRDILSMMEEEGYVLADALMASGERSILAYEELERLVQARLFDSAAWLDELDRQGKLNIALLDRAALKLDIYRIHILDHRGNSLMSSTKPHPDGTGNRVMSGYKEYVRPILEGKLDTLVVGFREGGYMNEPRYVIAVKRRLGGAVVLTVDARRLVQIRKEVGPGRLIQEIGGRPGVEYVVVQDTTGILMASRGVVEMSNIMSDPFLFTIFQNRSRAARILSQIKPEVFEVAASFRVEGDHLGVLRVGLEMSYYQNIVKNARYRLFLIVLVFLFVGIVGFSLIMANQNVRLLSESYHRVQTHTGEILQNLEDAVVALDGHGRITLFNKASENLFHFSSNKIIGKLIGNIDFPCSSILMESLASGKPLDQEEECMIGDQKKTLDLRTSVLKGKEGEIEAVILVATDMTSQRQLEYRLRQQEKFKTMGELAAGVAHEIRNPIHAIGMIAQRFIKEFRPREDEDEFIDLAGSVVQEVERINTIIQRFLRFARPPKFQLIPVDVKPFLQEVASLFQSSAQEKNIEFIKHVRDNNNLMMDSNQMKQALLNLLHNGLDATPSGGRIQLKGYRVRGEYWIEISDTGSGIDDTKKMKIFDLYYTTKASGTGMGLPLVYQIVQSHGGKIDVESKMGQGSVFRIRLPLKNG